MSAASSALTWPAGGGELKLVVGLGNPGREYQNTRHNIGWMVLDLLAAANGKTFRAERKWKAEAVELPGTILLKPQTYMNLSGESVAPLARFFKFPLESILVVYDDMALPLGRLRLRAKGSAGGHNGLQSIITHLGADAVPRLRLGIGAPAGDPSWVGHVLGGFREEERPVVEKTVRLAAEAVGHIQTKGFTSAMNCYNQQPLS
jgi:PTH1 family peptidyl-tRNA hydrolase